MEKILIALWLLQQQAMVIAFLRSYLRLRRRRMWVRDIFLERQESGEQNLIPGLCRDHEQFFGYFRMTPETFDELLQLLEERIRKKDTNWRLSIPARDRLAITLRYLATGCSQRTLSFSYRVGHSTVSKIIEETCKAIWEILQPIYMKFPTLEDDWKLIARGFQHRWNFPMCVGAIDGKHVAIQAPCNAGSEYYNYKGFHSVVLLAMCDANYCFTMINVGDSGRHSDGGVFSSCEFGKKLRNCQLNLPSDDYLPLSNVNVPYCIVGDAAFPLKTNLLRPYPGRSLPLDQRIFNYRLSRARRVIENAFGILTARWRVFLQPIHANPDKVILICQAACCLHNFLQKRSLSNPSDQRPYCPSGFTDREDSNGNVVPGSWRNTGFGSTMPLRHAGSNNHSRAAKDVRERYMSYFISPVGEVSWQLATVERGGQ